ncbi:MAG: DNA polymerase III subunit delta' [Deltaproteobacteria bacterium CG_4_8_14_3_um_filter_51_11]|nr:MAG: DNA polymerase III subunit delta' [Desulfobacteraceae bacterium CG2_30_51_40]PIP48254.1 MAG: DNA polymerase III subunit delta' [Deltaproteobacteria bacterium CG23_combo_of_CG06-09_8_20_14_all_51_20]PIX20438.1 MAG: DNA polymerase III subunit delta' [Deltaproteobacteria bacterium CG_4_8_14_3_um_filter_51_11]PIY22750.1 MAG: DNA polymerase III subunit delta' [Deltaproteobacteria bacterium CG_4_10_14_3_um_filter_51_14]PJB34490.1 MAG: DNA polymerase III subunit delta' [Deltaproteobacteria bac
MEFMRFADIVGQDLAVGVLIRSKDMGRIPHAYLFTGMKGVGKTTTARAFAFYLNCEDLQGGDACGMCRSCRRMKSDNFPDFKEISPDKGLIRIDAIREIRKELQYPPLEAAYRFTVIREGDKMTVEAANAFLKTLEEPPRGNILVVTAAEPLDLLPTIVSRCQRVPFSPIKSMDIERMLRNKGQGENDGDRSVIAGICRGSPGRAIRMFQSGFMEMRRGWLEKLRGVESLDYGEILDMARQWSDLDKKRLLDPEEGGTSAMEDILDLWSGIFRDLLVIKTTSDKTGIMNRDAVSALEKLSTVFTEEALVDILYILNQAEKDIRRNRNSVLVAQYVLMSIKERAGQVERRNYV